MIPLILLAVNVVSLIGTGVGAGVSVAEGHRAADEGEEEMEDAAYRTVDNSIVNAGIKSANGINISGNG